MGDLPRSAWNGTLRLRELVLPIGLVGAKRNGNVELRTLHGVCGQRVERANFCPEHGKVPDEELVKGWEIAPGEYMAVDVDELAAVAPRDTRVVDVYAIVAAGDVDPLLTLKQYVLLPTGSPISRQGYAILAEALEADELAALSRFTAWGAEHVGAITGRRYTLELRELAPHTDLRDFGPVAELIAEQEPADTDVAAARKLLARLEVPFEPALVSNLHRGRVEALLAAQLAGGAMVFPNVDEPPPAVSVDIRQALDRSLRGVPRARSARLAEALART